MSRIASLAHHAVNEARREISRARDIVRKALDDSDTWLVRYAKDMQCDDEDIVAITGARAEIARLREEEL